MRRKRALKLMVFQQKLLHVWEFCLTLSLCICFESFDENFFLHFRMFGPTENVGQTKIVLGLTRKIHFRRRKLFYTSLKA